MGAFTGSPVNSVERTAQLDVDKLDPGEVSGHLRVSYFSYTHSAGAGTGEVNLIQLPPGRIRIFPDLSRIVTSQFAATADLHLGYRAYTQEDGTAVAEDDNAFLDNADAGGGALDQAWGLPADGEFADNVQADGLIIYAMIDTGNIEDTDTISGYVVYSLVN